MPGNRRGSRRLPSRMTSLSEDIQNYNREMQSQQATWTTSNMYTYIPAEDTPVTQAIRSSDATEWTYTPGTTTIDSSDTVQWVNSSTGTTGTIRLNADQITTGTIRVGDGYHYGPVTTNNTLRVGTTIRVLDTYGYWNIPVDHININLQVEPITQTKVRDEDV